MALSTEQLFDVQSEFVPVTQLERYGKTIFITTSEKATARQRVFGSYAEAVRFFEGSDLFVGATGQQREITPKLQPTLAVQAFYKQQQSNPINVIRFYKTAQDTILTGGTAPVLATIAALGDDDSTTFDGVAITDLDFSTSGGTSFAAVATNVQERIRAAGDKFTNATFEYNSALNRFILTIAQADVAANSELSGFLTGDVAEALGMNSGTLIFSHAAETIEQMFANLDNENVDYDLVTVEQSMQETQDVFDAVDYLSTKRNKKIFLEFYNAGSYTAGDMASALYRMFVKNTNVVVPIFDNEATRDYKSVGLASEYAGVDYFGLDTLPDGKWIYLKNFQPTQLTEEQARELRNRNCNFFTYYGRYRIVSEGVTGKSGEWLDASIWADWFGHSSLDALFALFLGAKRIPATPRGLARMENALLPTLRAGVRNGGATPGRFPEETIAEIQQATNNPTYNGVTETGWYIYFQPLSQRSAAQVAQRRAPTIYIWINGSGSFHFASIRAILREGGSEITVTPVPEEEPQAA